MRPLTDQTPKPLLKVGGRSLIEWHLIKLAAAGLTNVVVNNAWLGKQIETYLGDGSRWNVRIRHSHEETALETAGGVAKAKPWAGDEPFLVINGDVWTDWDPALARDHGQSLARSPSQLAHLVLVPNPPQHQAGDFWLDQNHQVIDQIDDDPASQPSHPPSTRLTFSGIGIYKPSLFEGISGTEPVALAPLLRNAMRAKKVAGSLHTGQWHDIGTVDRLERLDQQLEQQGYGDI